MGYTKYPITDYNNLNVDWLVDKVVDVNDRMDMLEAGVSSQVDEWLEDNRSEIISDILSSIGAITKRHNYVLIGDSFSIGVVPGVAEEDWKGWADYAKEAIEHYSNSRVWTARGLIAPGASGFASTLPFQTMLQYVYDQMIAASAEPSEITDIVVLGGSNDYAYLSGVENAIQQFLIAAKNLFPNAAVRIGVLSTRVYQMYNGLRSYYELCKKYGAAYMPTTLGLLCDPSMISSDGLHLTAFGYAYYAPWILQAILTGETHYRFNLTADLVARDSSDFNFFSSAPKASFLITEDSVTMKLYNDGTAMILEGEDYNMGTAASQRRIAQLSNPPRLATFGGRGISGFELGIVSNSALRSGFEAWPVFAYSLAEGVLDPTNPTAATYHIYLTRTSSIIPPSYLPSGSSLRTCIPYTEIIETY